MLLLILSYYFTNICVRIPEDVVAQIDFKSIFVSDRTEVVQIVFLKDVELSCLAAFELIVLMHIFLQFELDFGGLANYHDSNFKIMLK